jgi:hypothetical protein
MLHADKSIEKQSEDVLGYGPFAQTLARVIHEQSIDDGIVIAIDGAWGSGKTSALNLTLESLAALEKSAGVPPERYSVIVRFEPWMFTGQPDLVAEFFFRLGKSLEVPLGKAAAQAAERMGQLMVRSFQRIMEYAALAAAATGNVHAGLASRLLKMTLSVPKPKAFADLESSRRNLCKLLLDSKKRIVVVIDDVDRLTPTEMAQVLGMLKSVADFPAIVYLLCADFDVVSRAVETPDSQLQSNAVDTRVSYLEKIIQVKLRLPQPTSVGLRTMLYEHLGRAAVKHDLLASRDLEAISTLILRLFIRTPRAVIQLSNALKVSWAALSDSVYFPDLVAVEAIRIFSPKIYAYIGRHSDQFVDRQKRSRDIESPVDAVIKLEPHAPQSPLKELLDRIFPPSSNTFERYRAMDGWRVHQEGGFEQYFGWNRAPGYPSVAQFRELQQLLDTDGDIGAFLLARLGDHHHGVTLVEGLLDAITIGGVQIEHNPKTAIVGLANIANDLESRQKRGSALTLDDDTHSALSALFGWYGRDAQATVFEELLNDAGLSVAGGEVIIRVFTRRYNLKTSQSTNSVPQMVAAWAEKRVNTTANLDQLRNPQQLLGTIADLIDFGFARRVAQNHCKNRLFMARLLVSYVKTSYVTDTPRRLLNYSGRDTFISAENFLSVLDGEPPIELSWQQREDLALALDTLKNKQGK